MFASQAAPSPRPLAPSVASLVGRLCRAARTLQRRSCSALGKLGRDSQIRDVRFTPNSYQTADMPDWSLSAKRRHSTDKMRWREGAKRSWSNVFGRRSAGQFVLNRGGPLSAARLPTWQNLFPCETVTGLRGRRPVGRDRVGTFSPSIAVLQCVDHPARDWQMPLATP